MTTILQPALRSVCALLMLLAGSGAWAAAAENDSWKFSADIYLYATPLSVELPNGVKDEISFSDLIDNLDMVFMGGFGAERGKWALRTDLIYMDVNDNVDQPITPVLELRELGMKSWIVSPMASYEVFRGEKFSASLTAGLRYLWVEVPLEFRTLPPLPDDRFTDSGSDSHLDAVAGVNGNYQINDKWFASFHVDAGAGDSDYVWQGLAMAGYKFERIDAMFGYRYMYWELDADALKSLELKGPIAGIRYRF